MTYYSVGPVMNEPVTAVTATPSIDVGTQRVEGANHYVYVYNNGGSSIQTGMGCVIQSGATGLSVTVSSVTSADFLVGVAVNTIAASSYGWVVTRGITAIEAIAGTGGTIDSMQLIELGANGCFAPVSNTSGATLPGAIGHICGKALAEIVSGASGNAWISAY